MKDEIRTPLDQALASEHGVTVQFRSMYDAVRFRMTVYAERRHDARHNAAIYPPGDPLHDRSIYDCLMLRIVKPDPESPDQAYTVRIEPRAPMPEARPIDPAEDAITRIKHDD